MDKKKRGKHKYLGSYAPSLNGEYEYSGVYYKIDVPEESLKRIKRWCAVMAAVIAVLFVLAGVTNAASSRVMYVMLPYVAAMLPIAFMLADVYRIARYQKPMTQKQYDQSVVQLKAVTIATLALVTVSAVGDIIFLVFFCAADDVGPELIYMAGCIAIIAVSTALLAYQRRIICIDCQK